MPKVSRPALNDRIVRYLLAGVALAAGITGLVLLVVPVDTGRYFSWGLEPAPLAALIGGSYLASLLVFGVAMRRSWTEVRGLVTGTLALTVPMIASTFAHLGVFEFSRWQAWGWVFLFLASPLSFGAVLWRRRGAPSASDARPAGWARTLAAVLAVGYLVLAFMLWVDPTGAGGTPFPFALSAFGGRVLGSWVSFLAFLAAWTATHTRSESRIPALGLTAFGAGALVGGLRTMADLTPAAPYLAALAVLTVVSWLMFGETRQG